MDPSYLPTLCFEEIMDFFRGKELLQLMTVSKNWHHTISSSSFLMSKLQFEIREDWIACCGYKQCDMSHFKQMALESDRAYSNILVAHSDDLMPQIFEVFTHPARTWKSVEFFTTDFESIEELTELFSCFDKTVKNLNLHHVTVRGNSKINFENFKKLETLKIYFVDSIIYKEILQTANNLTFLELGMLECITESSIVAVKNLKHLKVLHMSKDWSVKFFVNDEVEIKFKLKEFDMSLPRNNEEIDTENFIKFLESQNEMEKLSLIEWFSFKVLDAIFRSNIKELSLWDFPESGYDRNGVSFSKSIETLDIKLMFFSHADDNIQEFLSRMPNAKNLKLRQINETVATFIAEKMKKIQRISLIHEHVSDGIRQILPNVVFN